MEEVQGLMDDLVPQDKRGRDLTRAFNEVIEGSSGQKVRPAIK
jgi:hypothetical protein